MGTIDPKISSSLPLGDNALDGKLHEEAYNNQRLGCCRVRHSRETQSELKSSIEATLTSMVSNQARHSLEASGDTVRGGRQASMLSTKIDDSLEKDCSKVDHTKFDVCWVAHQTEWLDTHTCK